MALHAFPAVGNTCKFSNKKEKKPGKQPVYITGCLPLNIIGNAYKLKP